MRKAQDVHDELRAGLREAAEAHEPDRARILARVERGMAGAGCPARAARDTSAGVRLGAGRERHGRGRRCPRGGRLRGRLGGEGRGPAAADRRGLADARTLAGRDEPGARPARTHAQLRCAEGAGDAEFVPVGHPVAGDLGARRGPFARRGRRGRPAVVRRLGRPAQQRVLGAEQCDPEDHAKQLTSLTVELKIEQTGGVTDAGAWRSAPEDDFTTTVVEKDGFLVYTWVLKPGRTVWPGEWVFAGQYDHDRGGRDAEGRQLRGDARDRRANSWAWRATSRAGAPTTRRLVPLGTSVKKSSDAATRSSPAATSRRCSKRSHGSLARPQGLQVHRRPHVAGLQGQGVRGLRAAGTRMSSPGSAPPP